MAVEAGTRIGRFVIHEYLGQGDLGLVFRAQGPTAGSVAVKVLRGLADAEGSGRFRALARRLTGLRHPNVVGVQDFGAHDGVPYVIEQHVAGGSLSDHLRTGSLDQPAVIRVLRGIAAGVDHAHGGGFVHGALKPQQVLLDHDHQPFVSDFGLAMLRWPPPDGVSVIVPERGAAYAAPELVTGGRPTAAADRYAFASLAYQLLTGHTPFEGEPHEVMRAQLDGEPAPPSTRRPSLGPRLDAVLLRGLAKAPGARWGSCSDLVEALTEALGPAGPEASGPRPGPVPEPAPAPPARRARLPLAVAGVLAALLLAGGSAATWLAGQPPPVALGLSSETVPAGGTLAVEASGLRPDQAGTVELHSDPEQIGVFRADRSGRARARVTIPQDAAPGRHVVSLCWDGGCHGAARLTVVDEPPAPRPIGGVDSVSVVRPGGGRGGAPDGPSRGSGLAVAPLLTSPPGGGPVAPAVDVLADVPAGVPVPPDQPAPPALQPAPASSTSPPPSPSEQPGPRPRRPRWSPSPGPSAAPAPTPPPAPGGGVPPGPPWEP